LDEVWLGLYPRRIKAEPKAMRISLSEIYIKTGVELRRRRLMLLLRAPKYENPMSEYAGYLYQELLHLYKRRPSMQKLMESA
jgi:hypothetical protein